MAGIYDQRPEHSELVRIGLAETTRESASLPRSRRDFGPSAAVGPSAA